MRRTAAGDSYASIEQMLGSDPKDWVLPDVFEEHFEELEFRVQHFLRAHARPHHTLRVLVGGIEARLNAHLDALVLAGPNAVQKLTGPLLEELDPNDTGHVTAAVLCLARVGRADDTVPFFEHELPGVRTAAAVGGSLAAVPQLDALARACTAEPSSSPTASGWLEYLGLRGLPPANLFPALISTSEELLAAALLALRGCDSPTYVARLEELAESTSTSEVVRERALSLALAWGAPRAWSLCESQALDAEQVFPFSMLAYAMLGGPREHLRLLDARRLPAHRIHILRALGMSGNPAMVPSLLEHLGSKDVLEAKVAALSISAITGLDVGGEAFELSKPEPEVAKASESESAPEPEPASASESLPPLEEDDLDADLVPPPEDDLPRPDPQAIGRWWAQHGPSMNRATRHVRGEPFSAASLLRALEEGPLGLRGGWALALALRTGGGIWLNTRAFSVEQRRALAEARSRVTQLAPTRFVTF